MVSLQIYFIALGKSSCDGLPKDLLRYGTTELDFLCHFLMIVLRELNTKGPSEQNAM